MAEQDAMEPKCEVGPMEVPKTHEEARWFHQGQLAGLTIYAREKGDSTLRSENQLLRRLMDEAGRQTIAEFKRIAEENE